MPTPLEVYNFTFAELSSPEVAQLSVLDRFKLRAKLFWSYYLYLKDLPESKLTPELRVSRNKLLSRGDTLHATISKIAGAYDTISGWYTKLFGSPPSKPGSGLGIVPLVPVAVIGVSLAAIVKWSADAFTFAKKATLANQMAQRGASPGEINKVLSTIADEGSFFPQAIKTPLYLAGFGLGAYAIYRIYKWIKSI